MFPNGGGGGFSHKAGALATDMRCYFQCVEVFKKDTDLRIHLKLRHRNEDENELRRAFQHAEEEIALVRRSACTFQCALCQSKFGARGSFSGHVKNVHKKNWFEYLDQYGSCQVESAPFQCKICSGIVHYSGPRIDNHLKNVHKIKWEEYIEYVRSMMKGEPPKELPQIDVYTCKICNTSVKYIKEHLKSTHKVTETEYMELFPNESGDAHFKNEPGQYQEEDNRGGPSPKNYGTQQNQRPMNSNY